MRLAVRDSRFCCAFQPKVDIRTQQVVGVEALIRLRDENGEIQGPSEFIGLATQFDINPFQPKRVRASSLSSAILAVSNFP